MEKEKGVNILNYKKLWEGLKEVDGHRELKDLFPKGHISHGRGFRTIKECMDNIEKLHKLKRLQGMIDNRWQA